MPISQPQACRESLVAGEMALDIGEIAMARQFFESALELAKSMPAEEVGELRPWALLCLSRVHEREDRPEQALEFCTQALAHVSELRRWEDMLRVHDQMSNLTIRLGRYQQAIPFCEEAVRLAGRHKNPLVLAERLSRAGRCYIRGGLDDHAVVLLRQAVSLFRTQAEDPRIPVTLVDLGNALRRTQPAEAEACYKEAAGIWEAKDQLESATPAWVNLGMLCSKQNRHSEALAYYEKALHVREASPDTPPSRMATLLNNMANCYRRMGRFESARRAIATAIELQGAEGGRSLALAYGTRALIFRDEGKDAEAAEWFAKARHEHEKQPSPNLADLQEVLENEATAYERIGRTREATEARKRLQAVREAVSQVPVLDRELRGAAAAPAENAPADGAVLIHLDGRSLPNEVYQKYDLATLEDQLEAAVKSRGLGEFDGNEFGPERTTLFFYGRDAEALFAAMEEILKSHPLCQNARIAIRQGGPGSPEREVILPAHS